MSHQDNIARVIAVNQALRELNTEFVFVGGAIVPLYADRLAEEVRPTEDVDIVVEIHSRLDYANLNEQLRELNFHLDKTATFVGRYIYEPADIVVDFMPLQEEVLGFNNRWYIDAFEHALEVAVDQDNTIRIFSAPYYMAQAYFFLMT